MSESVFQKLEVKINTALEIIELLRLQLEDQEEQNKALLLDNLALKSKQTEWEYELGSLLRKLEGADLRFGKEMLEMESFETA